LSGDLMPLTLSLFVPIGAGQNSAVKLRKIAGIGNFCRGVALLRANSRAEFDRNGFVDSKRLVDFPKNPIIRIDLILLSTAGDLAGFAGGCQVAGVAST
jgi:hypothetical protein